MRLTVLSALGIIKSGTYLEGSSKKGLPIRNTWDIVCGPVANDQTAPVIDLFLDGMYDEEEAIKRLLPQKLRDQFVFKTPEAISLLRCKEVICL